MNTFYKWLDEISLLAPPNLIKGIRISALALWLTLAIYFSIFSYKKGTQVGINSFSDKSPIPLLQENILKEQNIRNNSKANIIVPEINEIQKKESNYLQLNNEENEKENFYIPENNSKNDLPSLIGESNNTKNNSLRFENSSNNFDSEENINLNKNNLNLKPFDSDENINPNKNNINVKPLDEENIIKKENENSFSKIQNENSNEDFRKSNNKTNDDIPLLEPSLP